jgi:hypothetical protein
MIAPQSHGGNDLFRRKVRYIGAHVRFGSKADVANHRRHVRFTPESGHR